MIQALAGVSSSHFAELLVLADPEVSKAIYRQEKLTPCRVFNTNRQKTNCQMDYCWLCPPVQAVLPLAVFFLKMVVGHCHNSYELRRPYKVLCVSMLVNTLRHFHGPLTVFALPVEPLATTLDGLPDFNFANASEEAPNNITITIANLSITELHRGIFSYPSKNGNASLVNYLS